ncbi:MAG: transcription antitermination factor NusB [Fusobacteriaceae bacterium]
MSRRIAREELFKIVFEAEMNCVEPKELQEKFLERGEVILSPKALDFFVKYVTGISQYNEELNVLINETMEGWNLDRIGSVEKTLLKCAVYELKHESTGHEIVVNEVVEIAKIYGDDKSHEFINGVLAKIIKG